LRVSVAAHEGNLLRLAVEAQDEDACELLDRRGCAVVEERDRAVGLASRIVLPRELRSGAHGEAALLPAEAPEHLLRLAVDLVERVRVARRDEEVAVRLDVDGVEVEVVVRRSLCPGFRGWGRRV